MRAIHLEHDDQGFTLVELLITLVILPIVVGGLTIMLIMVLQTQSGVTNTLTGSDDSSIATTLVSQDVESSTAVTNETSTFMCGSGAKEILATKDSTTTDVSSYVLVAIPNNSTRDELFRYTCTNGSTNPVSTTLVSNNVPTTLTANVYCGSIFTSNCASAGRGWEFSASVSKVSLSVTETTTNAKVYYTYAISAVPNLWSAASVGETNQEDPFPIPPLDILGNSAGTCSSPNMSFSGNASINVAGGAGDAFDNSTANDCIALSGNAVIDAAALETGDTSTGSSYTKSGNAVAPLPPTYAVPTGDPFSGLAPPTNPTATGSGSCASNSCTPGNYASSVSLSGGTWTVDAGTYVFTQPVSISGNTTVTFGSGTYLFEGGLSIAGNSSVTFGTGTYIFEGTSSGSNAISVSGNGTLTDGPGGALFYVESGVISFSGNGNIALSGPSGYEGIAIWQAAADTNVATLSGNSGVDAAYGGVYVPDGEVVPSGNSVLSASFVVAGSVNFSGNSGLTVGG